MSNSNANNSSNTNHDSNNTRLAIKEKKRWVIKVGSALLTDNGAGLDTSFINHIASQIAFLKDNGHDVVLVSSGSVAAGISQLQLPKRPDKINELQAAAAIGQASLIRSYEDALKPFDINIAQVLLTHADIANRERYLNAKAALQTLMGLGVLTVINENDSVATEEICFGDNDNLAALVANLIDAQILVILTDQDGLYTANPRTNSDAQLLSERQADDKDLLTMASGSGELGRGGMMTKLMAAQTAGHAGVATVIANGNTENVLQRIYDGETVGTLLLPKKQRLTSRKQWMLGQMKVKGQVVVDAGAAKVLRQAGRSLLPVGVLKVTGDFKRGELLSCVNDAGEEIARGLTNYHAEDASKIIGKPSSELMTVLGYGGDDVLIHRDNLVLL